MAKGENAAVTDLKKGLVNRSPEASDASTKLKGGDLNANAIRTSVAPTPKSLGPRQA